MGAFLSDYQKRLLESLGLSVNNSMWLIGQGEGIKIQMKYWVKIVILDLFLVVFINLYFAKVYFLFIFN